MANEAGAKIKELRKAAGITQAQLAEKTGISAKKISKAERGEIELTEEQMAAIEQALTAAPEPEPEAPAVSDEDLLTMFKSADPAAQQAAVAALKGDAPQNPMAAMMGMLGGMAGGGEGGEGGNPMAGLMGMLGGMAGGGEGGEGGNPMAGLMSMLGGMAGGAKEEKKEEK